MDEVTVGVLIEWGFEELIDTFKGNYYILLFISLFVKFINY